MQKTKAEPGLAPERKDEGELVFLNGELAFEYTNPRWVGSGRTIIDNKGNAVKQYGPFFDSPPAYTDEQELVEWASPRSFSTTRSAAPSARTCPTLTSAGSVLAVSWV